MGFARKILTLNLLFAFIAASPCFAKDSKSDFYRGLELYHSGDYNGATKAFRMQIDKTPADASVQRWLKLSERRSTKEEQPSPAAAEPKEKAVPLSPEPKKEPPQLKAADSYENSLSIFEAGDYESSLVGLKAFLMENPGHKPTQDRITMIMSKRKGTQIPPAAVETSSEIEETNDAKIARLEADLEKSKQMAARAIKQTKVALGLQSQAKKEVQAQPALPPPNPKVQQDLLALQEKNKDLLGKLERMGKTVATLTEERQSLEVALQKSEVERVQLNQNIEALNKEIEALNETSKKKDNQVKNVQAVSDLANRKNAESNKEVLTLKAQIKIYEKSAKETGAQIIKISNQLAQANETVDSTERALGQITSQYESAEETRFKLEADLKSAHVELKDLRSKPKHFDKTIKELQNSLKSEEASKQKLETQLKDLQKKHEALVSETEELKKKLGNASRQLRQVDQLLEGLGSSTP
jgi:DNA repair exonuclease SbcCD ATPase subunit